jgi:hypothetical protein
VGLAANLVVVAESGVGENVTVVGIVVVIVVVAQRNVVVVISRPTTQCVTVLSVRLGSLRVVCPG